jgi:proline iminopeptidase
MNPQDIEKMGELIPNSYVKICENGSHCTMFDDQEVYFEALHRFLNAIEAGYKKNK